LEERGAIMMFSYGAWLIVLGILGAANLIIAKVPSAKDLIGKLAPYQGWMGVASVFYGVWEVVQSITNMGLMAVKPPLGLIFWIIFLANAVLQIALGILFGVGVAKTFVKDPRAVENMDKLVMKLAPFQGILGIAAIGVGGAFIAFAVMVL
jgi:hypothetical protein